jgi:DNA processing protein
LFRSSTSTDGSPAVGALDACDPHPQVRSRLRAWLSFQATLGLRIPLAHQCLGRHPDPLGALRASRIAPAWSGAELDDGIQILERAQALALPIEAAGYPARLRRLSDAPPLLWVRGSPADLSARGVAIVGSRAATVYGLEIARRLGEELARAGVVVISGLARGIDAAAHEGALAGGGRTVAVQACGPELVYPAAHAELARRVRESGAVVTELPPRMRPRRPFFPLRNRLISALAEVVVIVEARPRSGSLTTARHALDQGGEVMAVPGPITAPTSQGTNGLLRDGASPLTELRDVFDAMGIEAPGEQPSSEVADPAAEAVLAALRARPRTRDELGRELSLPAEQLHLQLLELELAGQVGEGRDGRWLPLRPERGRG